MANLYPAEQKLHDMNSNIYAQLLENPLYMMTEIVENSFHADEEIDNLLRQIFSTIAPMDKLKCIEQLQKLVESEYEVLNKQRMQEEIDDEEARDKELLNQDHTHIR